MTRLCFQLSAFAVTAAFVVVIADIRRKPGMTPIVGATWLVLQKGVAVVAIGSFCFILLRQLGKPTLLDWCGVALSLLGTIVAARGKIDLAKSHAWAGYFRREVALVRAGIYAHVRNPIYAGIFIYIVGTFVTQLQHASMRLVAVNLILASYLVAFLVASARLEQARLQEAFGEEYERYALEVPAFVPLRRKRR
jgi:protein-S-isoprenylcysteine O-methyltransferase Ste14